MKIISFISTLLSLIILTSCSDQSTNVDPVEQNGRLKIYLVDSPSNFRFSNYLCYKSRSSQKRK